MTNLINAPKILLHKICLWAVYRGGENEKREEIARGEEKKKKPGKMTESVQRLGSFQDKTSLLKVYIVKPN